MPEVSELLHNFRKDKSITPEAMEATLRTLFAMELKASKSKGRKPRNSQGEDPKLPGMEQKGEQKGDKPTRQN